MKLLTMICAAAIAVCGTGRSQTLVDRITVHFSMPVMAGETTLPPGDCSIQVLRGSSDNVVLELRSESGAGDTAFVLVSRLSNSNVVTNGHAAVVLNHRNSEYKLDQIILPDHTGFQVLD